MMRFITVSAIALALAACKGQSVQADSSNSEPVAPQKTMVESPLSGDPYYQIGQKTLADNLAKDRLNQKAKNVILFIADGMDPTTVAAARIYDGQQKGMSGEENVLAFEDLPHLAMSKTYNTDMQTPDSAGTATAMMTGIKTRAGVINVTAAVERGDCSSSAQNSAISAGELAEQAGMAVGVISTARLTHATPATVYAHAADRGWEADSTMPDDANACHDIARQLIEFPYGDGLEVAMGGGRRNFLPREIADPEYADKTGRRKDGRDLTSEWIAKSDSHKFVWNTEQFNDINVTADTRILGLFESSHMQYEADRADDTGGEPSLAEMTSKAIDVLSQNDKGYFLMVESGRVDHAHHAGNAARALEDVVAFDEAIKAALEKTKSQETLIIVTADHGHTLAFQGYPERGNPILGLVARTNKDGEREPTKAADGKAYTTLVYGNGPGSVFAGKSEEGISRPEPTHDEVHDTDYKQQALIPGYSETHGGQDVTIYAQGPKAWLFDGVVEQNYIFHVIDHALDLNHRAQQATSAE